MDAHAKAPDLVSGKSGRDPTNRTDPGPPKVRPDRRRGGDRGAPVDGIDALNHSASVTRWTAELREIIEKLAEKPDDGRALIEKLAEPPGEDGGRDLTVWLGGRGPAVRDCAQHLGGDVPAAPGRLTGPGLPAGTQWHVGQTSDSAPFHSDLAVYAVPAAFSIQDTDSNFLTEQIVGAAHVPWIVVVLTGLDQLTATQQERVLSYTRKVLGDGIAVTGDHGDNLWALIEPVGWSDLLPVARRRQRLSQLHDVARAVATWAQRRADQERTAGAEARLSAAERLAGLGTDAATVRRELRGRQKAAVDSARRDVGAAVTRLVADIESHLEASAGKRQDIEPLLSDFPDRTVEAIAAVQDRFQATVRADVAWLDARLGTLFEAQRTAAGEPLLPTTSRPGQPRLRNSRWLDVNMGPLVRAAADFTGSVVVGMLRARFGGNDSNGLRKVAVAAIDSHRTESAKGIGAAIETVVDTTMERITGRILLRRAKSVLRDSGSAAIREGDFADVARTFYDGLADEFDDARIAWRTTQDENAPVPAEAAMRALAVRARVLSDEIHVDARGDAQ